MKTIYSLSGTAYYKQSLYNYGEWVLDVEQATFK
jgi:hypothetical protein